MKQVLVAGLLTIGPCVASWVFAHDTWLIPEHGSVSPGSSVALDLTSGMAFPTLDHAIDLERIDKAFCRLGGRTFEIGQRHKGSHALSFNVLLDSPGVATLWVDLKPKMIELEPKQVQEYLDEINAPAAVRQAWDNAGMNRRWREMYTKHSKTIVCVGEATSERAWAEPTGMTLEFVPETNPAALRVGDEFRVRVLKHGAALPGFGVGIIHAGDSSVMSKATDAEGRLVVKLDRAGFWLLRGTELRKSSTDKVDWESDFTTLTLEVQP